MARTRQLNLAEIADYHNIAWALHRTCRGKSNRADVQQVRSNPQPCLEKIAAALAAGRLPVGRFKEFIIHDPKRRIIHAAPLLDRIAHHALLRFMEPIFERVLLPCVFACRTGKGVHRAIHYAQRQSRRFPWLMHVDVRHYFPSIQHHILRAQLARRFRGDAMSLVNNVIDCHQKDKGVGLPIGALTSQHFANHYLNDADRWCLLQKGIRAYIRYMDDMLLWAEDKSVLLETREALREYLQKTLGLSIKPVLVQRSNHGLLFCGMTIRPFSLRPSLRRRRRYLGGLDRWEQSCKEGLITPNQLQQAYDAILSSLKPAHALEFRRRCLQRRETIDA